MQPKSARARLAPVTATARFCRFLMAALVMGMLIPTVVGEHDASESHEVQEPTDPVDPILQSLIPDPGRIPVWVFNKSDQPGTLAGDRIYVAGWMDSDRVWWDAVDGTDAFLHVLEAATGERLLSVPIGDALKRPPSLPVVADGVVYLMDHRGVATAVHGQSGQVLWQTQVGEPAPRDVWGSDPLLLVGETLVGITHSGLTNPDDREASLSLVAFSRHDGRVLWNSPVGRSLHTGLAAHGDAVYESSWEYAEGWSLHDGSTLWRVDWLDYFAGQSQARAVGAVAAGDVLAVNVQVFPIGFETMNFWTVALDPADGSEVWRHHWGEVSDFGAREHRLQPVADGSTVFVTYNQGLHALNASGDGQWLWSSPLLGEPQSPPAVSSTEVVIQTVGGAEAEGVARLNVLESFDPLTGIAREVFGPGNLRIDGFHNDHAGALGVAEDGFVYAPLIRDTGRALQSHGLVAFAHDDLPPLWPPILDDTLAWLEIGGQACWNDALEPHPLGYLVEYKTSSSNAWRPMELGLVSGWDHGQPCVLLREDSWGSSLRITPVDQAGNVGSSVLVDLRLVRVDPVIDSLTLIPMHPTAATGLQVVAHASCLDGDEVTLHYAWTRNGEAVDFDADLLDPSQLVRGDVWQVTVTAVSESGESSSMTSPEVRIGNAPASLTDLDLIQLEGSAGSGLIARATVVDADGDPAAIAWKWYRNDVFQSDLVDAMVPVAWLVPGDHWRVVAVLSSNSHGPHLERELVLGDVEVPKQASTGTPGGSTSSPQQGSTASQSSLENSVTLEAASGNQGEQNAVNKGSGDEDSLSRPRNAVVNHGLGPTHVESGAAGAGPAGVHRVQSSNDDPVTVRVPVTSEKPLQNPRVEWLNREGLEVTVVEVPREVGPDKPGVVVLELRWLEGTAQDGQLAFRLTNDDGATGTYQVMATRTKTVEGPSMGWHAVWGGVLLAMILAGVDTFRGGLRILGLSAAAVMLFSRVTGGRLLEQPTRAAIHDAIESDPGVSYGALRSRLNLSRGNLTYHLARLEQGGLIRRRVDHGQPSFFVVGAGLAMEGRQRRDPLLAAIGSRPGQSQAQIAKELGWSRQLVHWRLRRLHSAGQVRLERRGRCTQVFPV